MNPKKTSPKKAGGRASHDEEWMLSRIGEAELERMVTAGVLPGRVTGGWRPAIGEPFPMPNTDEVVVFEDYFLRELGFPIHPFLGMKTDRIRTDITHIIFVFIFLFGFGFGHG